MVAKLFHSNGSTDMTKLIVADGNFVNAPKKLNGLRIRVLFKFAQRDVRKPYLAHVHCYRQVHVVYVNVGLCCQSDSNSNQAFLKSPQFGGFCRCGVLQ